MGEFDVTIENYISSDTSICREERQYALYLNNILRYFGNEERRKSLKETDQEGFDFLVRVYQICGLINEGDKEIPKGITIKDVYYEVAFMRDFLERNRRVEIAKKINKDPKKVCLQKTFSPKSDSKADYSLGSPGDIKEKSFNYRLLNYAFSVCRSGSLNDEEVKNITEINYGRNDVKLQFSNGKKTPDPDSSSPEQSEKTPDPKFLIKTMMNAKPDLAVIYEKENEEYLLFLECKFESAEDKYVNSNDKTQTLEQTVVQGHVARFLAGAGYLKKDGREIKISDAMKKNNKTKIDPMYKEEWRSVLVEFDRTGKKLEIEKLIRLEKSIFEQKK